MSYYFVDYDDYTSQDLTINGKDYNDLITTCFDYCEEFSLSFVSVQSIESLNEQFLPYKIENLPITDGIRNVKAYYKCNDKNKEALLTICKDFFDWVSHRGRYLPEDLMFYRNDSSIFLWSETHEGVCAILNRENENISKIIENKGWIAYSPGDSNLLLPTDLM